MNFLIELKALKVRVDYKNVVALCAVLLILLYFRRGEQLISPQIWSEDGLFNLTSFMLHGWSNLFEPVQGYLITVSKLITNISASISIVYYPEISTYLAWVFIVLVGLAIAFSPTRLKFPILAALLVFLIPTDAENYGLPLYTFWFSSLLLFLVAMWQPGKAQSLKLSFLTLGGLSL